MGGSGGASAPAAPAAPTTQQTVDAYTGQLNAMYNASLKYDPLIAQQQLQMAQQYAPQMKAVSDALNPQASKMNDMLGAQAAQGMNAQMPDWMQQQYQSQMRAELGNQVGSGMGADYVSRGMLSDQQQYQQYYSNLGLSVAGLNPVYNGSTYQQQANPSVMNGYNYGQVSNNMMSGYGSSSSANASMYASNASMANARTAANGQMMSSGIAAVGTIAVAV